jgi:hypothetical protein
MGIVWELFGNCLGIVWEFDGNCLGGMGKKSEPIGTLLIDIVYLVNPKYNLFQDVYKSYRVFLLIFLLILLV